VCCVCVRARRKSQIVYFCPLLWFKMFRTILLFRPLPGICAPSNAENDFQTPPLSEVFKRGGILFWHVSLCVLIHR